jgi:hypothetical protein
LQIEQSQTSKNIDLNANLAFQIGDIDAWKTFVFSWSRLQNGHQFATNKSLHLKF